MPGGVLLLATASCRHFHLAWVPPPRIAAQITLRHRLNLLRYCSLLAGGTVRSVGTISSSKGAPMARQRRPHLTATRQKAGEVTVTRLPTVRCETCERTIAMRPSERASDVLTRHWRLEHSTS